MSERTAIVTLAIGDEFARRWREVCEDNWREYCDRHGYDLICINEPLDDSPRARDRSPSWQKLLILGQPFAEEYERIIWVDSDVYFAPGAPAITAGVPLEKVGAVDEWDLPSRLVLDLVRWCSAEEYYGAYGLPGSFDRVVQAGLMVTSPLHHREVFEHVYDSYEDKPGMYFEMRPLSYELQDRDLVHWIDSRFNVLWMAYKTHRHPYIGHHRRHPMTQVGVRRALEESYCLHFAGEAAEMAFALQIGSESPRRRNSTHPRASTPVVLFLFARPDTSARVLDAIRRVRPERLLVVANAPRGGEPGESERSAATRALLDEVDWDCEVHTNFAEHYLEQTERIESGIDWAFSLTEEAIFLEDDTVPDPGFFRFCEELLERYRDEERILSIGGNAFQFDEPASEDSYYFSRYTKTWGWASWRRAWHGHQPAMDAWPELREGDWLEQTFLLPSTRAYWGYVLDRTYRNRHAWDYAWMFDGWRRGGLHAIPNANLVSNIGFRDDATNTRPELAGGFADLPVEEIVFPLRHPAEIAPNLAADEYTDRLSFGGMVTDMFSRVRQLRQMEGSS